ncbi:MAG: hypothetical protein AB9836_06895 [Aminipila sp.]
MMHTIELGYKITRDELYTTKEKLYEFSKENSLRCIADKDNLSYKEFATNKSNKNHKNIWTLSLDNGLLLILTENLHREKNEIISIYRLYYRINLARIMGGSYRDLYNSQTYNYENVMQIINDLLKRISPQLPDASSAKIRRVDFTFDMAVDKNQLENYLKIARNSRFASKIEATAKEGDKTYKPDNSVKLRLREDESIKLSIYDKLSQMENNRLRKFSKENNSEKILRVELQISKNEIKRLTKANNIRNLEDLLEKSNAVAFGVFKIYLYKTFCSGRYYKYKTAMKIIEESQFKDKTKIKMLRFLEYTKKGKSIEKGIEKFKSEGGTASDVNRVLRKFEELKINPYTIGKRECVEELDNLYIYILDAIRGTIS